MSKDEKDEKELVEKYRKLTPENKLNALSNMRVALATQETTLKGVKSPVGAPKKQPAKRRITA